MQGTIRVKLRVSRRAYKLARLWERGLLTLAGIIMAGIISFLLGFNPVPQTVPLVAIVQRYPLAALVVGGILLFATFSALQISRQPAPKDDGDDAEPDLSAGWHLPRLLIATAISTASTTLFLALLAVVLLRPAWCPVALCPAPKVIAITNPHAAHDSNLEVYFTALQSDTFVIPGDPARYTLGNAPQSIGAVRYDVKTPQVYRVVFGIHSLQRGRFGMIISQVALVVAQVPPTPQPLNIWDKGAALNYNSDPFLAKYVGQEQGAIIPAVYTPLPGTHVQLNPGEADEVDLQVASRVPVDLRFQVQVTYRVTNESVEHTLTLPQTFEAVFSDGSNWHPYQLSGHFVPAT